MNLNEINSLDFVQLLTIQFSITPNIKSDNSIWLISPFRQHETTPSFHISKNYKYDIWFDHGNGLGGKIVDFYLHYLQTDLRGVLKFFNENSFSFRQLNHLNSLKQYYRPEYEIVELKDIVSFPLIQYLEGRKLPLTVVNRYCREIHYILKQKKYYAIAFPNMENGFELRNKYVKMCLVKKNISYINNSKNQLKIFESWSDFISYLVLFPLDEFQFDFLILNSISLLRKNVEFIKHYKEIHLYLDHDDAGLSASKYLLEKLETKVLDKSFLYEDCKDLNEYLNKI